MKIKIGIFEFDGSPEEFDQIVKSGAVDKCLGPTKIEPKKMGNEDLEIYLQSIGVNPNEQWLKIDPAELGIDTLKAKEAYILPEDPDKDV